MKEEMVSNYIAISPKEYSQRQRIISETFKGETNDNQILFPKGLGAVHPFDFEQVDKIIENIGIVNSMSDKIVDAIVGDFSVKVEDANAQTLIDDLVDDSNLKSKLRPWIKEAINKGNGFMELDLKDTKNIEVMRVMNANQMFVRRKVKGKVLGYNQFKGKIKTIINKSKIIPFSPNQIAHLQINKTPNDPYGIGLVWPNRIAIENWASSELDLHKLQTRKAGAPMHARLGQPGQKVRKADLDTFKTDMQYMTNTTEWVTDANVELKVVDFNGVLDNSIKVSEHDLQTVSLGFKIPMSILGIANNPEGLAKVNDKGFIRFIESVRKLVGEVLEEKIFRPFLREQSPKLDSKVKFEWELPDEEEKNLRLEQIKNALGLFDITPELRAALEIEYSKVMGLDIEDKLPTPEEARKKADEEEAEMKKQEDQARKDEETKIKQPEVPGAKKTANQKAIIHECKDCKLTEGELSNMKLSEYVNLKEIAGFNYSDYLVKILQTLRTHKFEELMAITEKDLIEGLLPKRDIGKLRVILKNGFRKNKTIRQIENDIKQSINLKDRLKIEEDGTKKVTLSASKRPIAIARTETVRLANEGLKKVYLENDVSTYRYLAAIDDRTTEICRSLDGQVFLTKEATPGVNMPPMHPMCRSSIVGLVD